MVTSSPPTDLRLNLAPWLQDAVRQAVPLGGYLRLRVRLRGNTLHLLCETTCPTEKDEVTQAVLQDIKRQREPRPLLTPAPAVPIHRLIIYGRLRQEKKSLWLSLINLGPAQTNQTESFLHLKPKNQARLGYPQAIAQYLSQNLSQWGIGIRVETQTLTSSEAHSSNQRLWITCECDYSPDYGLLTESLVQRLRELQIKGFRDGAIRCQIRGEQKPEWLLWVDLTPPEVMLRHWAQWGEPQAIARILTQALQAQKLEIQATVEQETCNLICLIPPEASFDQARLQKTIQDLLDGLAPQGLHQVLLKAQSSPSEQPLWQTQWALPGQDRPECHSSVQSLAQQGDLEALKFLLQQYLNPDLSERLATGGVHITLRQKATTLYIMTEAIACPPKIATLKAIANLLRDLEPHPFKILKVYGRRSGQTEAIWQQSLNFRADSPELAESPEFISVDQAADDEESVRFSWPKLSWQWLNQAGHKMFAASRLWHSNSDNGSLVLSSSPAASSAPWPIDKRSKGALFWAVLGLVMMAQLDWFAGRWLQWNLNRPELPMLSLTESESSLDNPRSEVLEAQLPQSNHLQRELRTTAPKAIARPQTSPYPSFDNLLLDDKLALYHKRVEANGVPDILIIGSSRALRGLDPAALQAALSQRGYPPLDIFNFGINGATAQVVDLVLHRLIPPEQLPKLIIFADGARAFNSGRQDLTYERMARSPGFQSLEEGTLHQSLTGNPSPDGIRISLNPDDLNQAAQQWFGTASQIHAQRQLFKERLFNQTLSPLHQWVAIADNVAKTDESKILGAEPSSFDLDGFLPLARRFNPETYYQDHPKVSGHHDGDYADFNLAGVQQEKFLELLAYLESQAVHLVLLNQPLTDYYLDPVRAEYEQQFQDYVLQLTTPNKLDFIDLVPQKIWQKRYDFFSDPSHLNQFGAAQVAQELAGVSRIPWPDRAKP